MTTQSVAEQTRDTAEYIAEHLVGCEYGLRDFVASALNPLTPMSLHLEICPDCGFLHTAETDCDVCATIHNACGPAMPFLRQSGDTTRFQAALADARCRRARTLYDQWMNGHLCADALFWASMTEPSEGADWSAYEANLHFAPAPGGPPRLMLAA